MAAHALLAAARTPQPLVTFTVRQREDETFVVCRELSGPDVQEVEETFTSDPIRCPRQANDFAYRAAESFTQRYPVFFAKVRPTRIAVAADPFSDFESFHR